MSIEKILNKRSNDVVTDGGVETPKKPTSSQLDNGEIAVNYHKGTERLFMKNDNDEVVEFISKDEVDKKQDKVDGVNIVRKEFEDDYGPYTEGVVEVDNGVYNAMLRNNQIVFTSSSDKGGIFFEPIGHTIGGKYFPAGVKCKHKKTDDPLDNDLRIARMCDLPSVTPQVQSNWNETDTTSKAYILNKPTIPTSLSQLSEDSEHRTITDNEQNDYTYAAEQFKEYHTIDYKNSIGDWKGTSITISNDGNFRFENYVITNNTIYAANLTATLVRNGESTVIIDKQIKSKGSPYGNTLTLNETFDVLSGDIIRFQNPLTSVTISETGLAYLSYIVLKNIPTKTSDLTNDSGFVDTSVNNLVNYYLKTDTYTKTEVDNKIGDIETLLATI